MVRYTTERLIEKAKHLDFEKPEAAFLRVSKAAEELGRQDEFAHANKLFSKFAHPTAIAVMDFVPPEAIRQFKKIYHEGGLCYGKDALVQIDSFLKTNHLRGNLHH